MNKCPITYEECSEKYSDNGLKLLSPVLKTLNDLEYTAEEQRLQAFLRSYKMSVQGMQAKLSAVLSPSTSSFSIVDIKGRYILKPQHQYYPELPENESLTMKLAGLINIEVPVCGMVWSRDGSLTYFIKRFDRYSKIKKVPLEDFAQLAGMTRDTKYNYSFEKLISLVDKHCTFPVIEKAKLFRRTIFNYLCGNEDMHLKNYSLISRDGKVELSPAYDLLNTSIVLSGDIEESALPIKGKKKKLNRSILVDYLALERMKLNEKIVFSILNDISNVTELWIKLINRSFLSVKLKDSYKSLLEERLLRMEL